MRWISKRRILMAAALIALLLCLLPAGGDAPETPAPPRAQSAALESGVPAGADLSERTSAGCFLHRTLVYAPCGHSVQRRERLDARLVGLTRAALEDALPDVLPGAFVTGFSAAEVDVSLRLPMPCPLHWVLRTGEDGMLAVCRNLTGEALEQVRATEIPAERAPQEERQALIEGRVFDDVQALEGYLESLSS